MNKFALGNPGPDKEETEKISRAASINGKQKAGNVVEKGSNRYE